MDRRTLVVGGASSLIATSNGASLLVAPPPVSAMIALRIFIPSQAVYFLFMTFNGGTKASIEAVVDLAASGAASLTRKARDFGETRRYENSATETVPGKPDWFRTLRTGATPLESKRAEATDYNLNATWKLLNGATHGVYLDVDGANPLAPTGTPAIDFEVDVGLRRNAAGKIEYCLVGAHDSFPSYELKINGKLVHAHDCVAGSNSPADLDPGMEIQIDSGWKTL